MPPRCARATPWSKIKPPEGDVFAIDDILGWVRAHRHESHLTQIPVAGTRVRIGTRRLRMFLDRGTDCLGCGLKGEAFVLVPHSREGATQVTHHSLQLYGTKDGERVWITRDHTLAQGLGGLDTLANSQPLCHPCNQHKGRQEHQVLIWLRRHCGLDAHGLASDGHSPFLDQALAQASLAHVWQQVRGALAWFSEEPMEQQMARLMPAWVSSPLHHDAGLKAQQTLRALCEVLGVDRPTYQAWCEQRGPAIASLPSTLPGLAAALGFSDAGMAVFMNDRALLHMQEGTTLLRQRWACRAHTGRLFSLMALAHHQKRMTTQARKRGMSVAAYRVWCHAAGQTLVAPLTPLSAKAHQLGMSEAGLQAFYRDVSQPHWAPRLPAPEQVG